MTIFFVSRHKGAIDWALQQGFQDIQLVAHLDTNLVKPGDEVWGTLPVNLAATVIARGAKYRHLVLNLPEELRGKELNAAAMAAAGARLERYDVKLLSD